MIIGVTGSIGTGKTTVAKIFGRLGAHVIDADKIVHRILDKPVRRKLAGFVFDDEKMLRALCRAIHPLVKKEIFSEIRKNRNKKLIIDAPLLIESGLHRRCDYVIVVKAAQRKQVARTYKKLHLSTYQIRKRIRAQMPLKKKLALADFVINNNGSLQNTEKQVRKVWEELARRKKWKR